MRLGGPVFDPPEDPQELARVHVKLGYRATYCPTVSLSETERIREPSGIPLAEAGFYQEEMITAVLDMSCADRSYVLDSMKNPSFLAKYWQQMIEEMKARADAKPE